MKIETNAKSTIGSWVKTSLCAAMVMGMAITANTALAGNGAQKQHGKPMTPFARIAKIQVVKNEDGSVNHKATYDKAKAVALDIATYIATVNDAAESGFPSDWIVGGHEGGGTIESSIMQIPSPNPIDPANPSLGIKKANVMDLCNSYYAKQALGVAPIAGTTKKIVNGYTHSPALPCELSTWNDDENIYVDMLDPNAIFSIFFTDVLVSEDMQDPAFASAITALPVAVKNEIKTVVYKALDKAGYEYNAKDKPIGPKYRSVDEIFEVVAASPNTSPYKHFAYTKTSGEAFAMGETSAVSQAIIDTMSIHGTPEAGTHDPELESILSPGSKWRSARHLPLGLPGKPEKNWVIEACSPTYAKMAMGTGMHHATALPCEISVQRVDRDGNGSTESLVVSYLDPGFMFGAMFSDISDDEKAALAHIPGNISGDLENIVKFALDDTGMSLSPAVQFYYNMLP